MTIGDAALTCGPGGSASPFEKTGALVRCPRHPEVWIRVGEQAKEKAAFELADIRLRDRPAEERQAGRWAADGWLRVRSVLAWERTPRS
jgi:hypothetical protein